MAHEIEEAAGNLLKLSADNSAITSLIALGSEAMESAMAEIGSAIRGTPDPALATESVSRMEAALAGCDIPDQMDAAHRVAVPIMDGRRGYQ